MKYLIEDTKEVFNFDVELDHSELTTVAVTTIWLLNSKTMNKDIEETVKVIRSELEALKRMGISLKDTNDVYFASKSLHEFILKWWRK